MSDIFIVLRPVFATVAALFTPCLLLYVLQVRVLFCEMV